jgi:hypothetical protein
LLEFPGHWVVVTITLGYVALFLGVAFGTMRKRDL